MRNKSFFLTQEQYRNRTKTVTRRQCKRTPEVGERFMGIVKGQGLKKGEKVQKMHASTYTAVDWIFIWQISKEDVIKEGFPNWTPLQFINFYCKANRVQPGDVCCRQAFKHDD